MAAVSLHPLASRSGVQSATVVSVNILPSGDNIDPFYSDDTTNSHLPQLYGSSPTTRALSPNPLNDRVSPQTHSGHDSSDDEEGEQEQHHWHDDLDGAEFGLNHDNLDEYPAFIQDDENDSNSMPSIRAMTANQFADLQQRYADLDVPHSVLFPFLHGVDGDNAAQNAFFRAPLTGMPTPLYRGLTIIRADMPTQEQQLAMNRKRTSSSASKISNIAGSQRSRADSLATTASTFSNDSGSSDEEDKQLADLPIHSPSKVTTSNSLSSISSSTTCSDYSRNSSLFSRAMSSDTSASSTCIDMERQKTMTEEVAPYQTLVGHGPRRSNTRRTPAYDAQPRHSLLNSTILPCEILSPPLMANLDTNSLEVARQSFLPTGNHCWINGASFVKPKQADGISLRNFKTQCAKYATISDIVIYCPAGLHQGVLTLAHWARQAQESCYRERIARGLGGLRYNVFVITDSFDVFERHQPHLIAVDAGGFSRNRVDFVERERDEMQRFTDATEIDDNVWMGNTANVPYSSDEFELDGSSVSLDSYLPQEVNPNAFSVVIEALEQTGMPSPARLSHASHFLDAFEATALFEVNSKEALRELEEDESEMDEERPSLGPSGWSPGNRTKRGNNNRRSMPTSRQQLLYPPPSSIVHFTALASGSCFEDDVAEDDAIEDIVNLCVWMKKQACPTVKAPHGSGLLHGALRYGRSTTWPKQQQQQQQHQPLPRRILLHCSDGYTDTSILGLAYLMYSRQLSLPEAYLDLQNRCNRCFFVYGKDVPFLQRLSQRIAVESKHLHASTERSRSGFNWSINSPNESSARRSSSARRYSNEETASEQSVWARGLAAATGLVTQGPNTRKSGGGNNTPVLDLSRTITPTPRKSTPTPSSPNRELSSGIKATSDHRWFTNPNFQGSFPSKVLPFLYLGNLNHAMNPTMLHAIGITHVVSVGESALVPPDVEESLFSAATAVQCGSTIKPQRKKKGSLSSTMDRSDSLWEQQRQGKISVLDLHNVSDDGIDSLRPHMKQAIEYIEQARLQGGKVLVHCRVGVSRSATICIAYVMAHCDLSMIESFLLVRSRRMNVLTQPTLLFVWELRGFEAQLANIKRKMIRARHESKYKDISMTALSISSNDCLVNNNQGISSPADEEDELLVDIGAGAGSVYEFEVKDYQSQPFNSGSLTRLDYYSAKLTHGYFCKLLSELNARYMVS